MKVAMNANIADELPHSGKTMDENPFYDAMGIRLIFLLRMALAISGWLLTQNPHSPLDSHAMTSASTVLFLYLIYSVIVYGFVFYREQWLHSRNWHWLDMVWWLAVVASSGGGHSVFYLFFIYPIIIASFRWGTNEGIGVTVAAVSSWLLVALGQVGNGAWPVQWQSMLLKAVTLLVLGYAIALWAGFEALQKKRLVLFGDLNRLPNPRFGPERLICMTLERLCCFYRADNCAIVLTADVPPGTYIARTAPPKNGLAEIPDDVLRLKLLSLPEHCAIAYSAPSRWSAGERIHIDAARNQEQRELIRAQSRAISRDFEARSWVSVPLQLRGTSLGRLLLISQHGRFGVFDIYMLRQAMEKFMPLVETVKLLNRLASEAADKERGRICLDLHDGAIQPYLGLKLGLESLLRKIDRDNALMADLEDLYRMTTDSIAELRRYVTVLNTRSIGSTASWLDGLHRQVDKFRRFYGLEIKVNILSNIVLNDRLTAEILQMIGESLSNIGRHTNSRQVIINLSSHEERFIAQIINDSENNDVAWQDFTPVSLTKRAQYLGGNVDVMPHSSGGTEVLVTIPL